MKKNFLFGLLALMLAGFGFGGVSMAEEVEPESSECTEENAVAKIDETNYCDFTTAVQAANGGIITLLKNIDSYTFTEPGIIKIKKGDFKINNVIVPENCFYEFTPAPAFSFGGTPASASYAAYTIKDAAASTSEGSTITYFSTLNKAFDGIKNKEGAVVTLLNEISLPTPNGTFLVTLNNTQNFTLDLNGKKLTVSNGARITMNNAKLTITNGTIETTEDNSVIFLTVKGGSELTLSNSFNFVGHNKSNPIYIEGTSILNSNGNISTENNFSIAGNGSNNKGGYTININGGSIISTNAPAIYHPNTGTLNINGGTIEGTTAVEVRAGTLTVGEGAVLKSNYNGEEATSTPNGNGSTTVGAALAIAQHTTKLPITVNINGGTLEGPAAIYQSNPQNNELSENSKVETTITDGVIKGDVINTVESDEGKYKLAINGGSYSKKTDSNYVLPEHKYLAEQEDGTYQLAAQTAISEIKVNITAPVKDGAPIIPTTDTEGITFTADGIKWYKTVDNTDTELSTDEKYAENTAYKVVIPYTVADSHYLADSYTVTPTAGTENHATAGQITITFEADAVAEGYTIKFVNHDGTELKTYTVAVNETPVYDGTTPTKASDSSYNYSFKGWTPEIVAANDNATYTAEFTATSKPSYSGGGGSSRSSSKTTTTDDTKKAEDTSKADETKADETKADESKSDENNADESKTSEEAKAAADAQALKDGYSQEFIDAYNFARKNNITTKDTIREADMDAPLTRIAMAKMLSQYAINVLGKTPDTSIVVPNFPDVDAQLDADYDNGVTLAYQLGIMGIGIEEFRPFDLVTRAEFGTALSRMLFGLEDGEGNEWYSTHLAKLIEEKIITNDNPNLKELRGYVMIMLMRSAQ